MVSPWCGLGDFATSNSNDYLDRFSADQFSVDQFSVDQ